MRITRGMYWTTGAVAAALALAACSESNLGPNASTAAALTAALSNAPLGFGSLATSFVGSAAPSAGNGDLWVVGGREASFDHHGLMGGGIGEAFVGGIGRGRGFGHEGPFGGGLGCAGTFDAATGRVSCADATLPNGLTVTRSAAYHDASGAAQQAFDSVTTNSVNVRIAVRGTVTYDATSDSAGEHRGPGDGHHGYGEGRGARGMLLGDTAKVLTATTTIASASDRTVSGLASGSTQRTANGTSGGTESTQGTTSRGAFSATRTTADTTKGLVVPIPSSVTGPTYPTAGTVIRAMTASLTYTGGSTTSVSRREVVTYDGTATAKVEITENGTTKSCTRPLPRGPLTCG